MYQQLELFKSQPEYHHQAQSYTGIYALHKYWSKKPSNIIREFIKKYTTPNDVIVDPFCGSGVSIIESILTNRKAIGIDINPSAIFITKQILEKIDINKVLIEFEELKSKLKDKIDYLYEIRRDDNIYYATHFIWNNEKLTEIWLSQGSKKIIFEPLQEDENKALEINIENIPFFYPKNNFYHNSRINTKREERIDNLFTPRNLYALSILYNEITKIQNEEVRDILKFAFTSSLGQSSKMVFVIQRRGKNQGNIFYKKEVGSWVIGYWKPKEYFEINVWKNFESKLTKIIKAKKEQCNVNYYPLETDDFTSIINDNKSNFCLINKPAQEFLTSIPNNSVDYIISDPPHGDRIPYLELSMLWNSWLEYNVDYENEIVISNAKERGKNIDNYNKLMNKVYSEIYRILKPNKYFSLMFNSLDDDTWINLILFLNKLGFSLKSIETLGYSAHSVVQDNRKKGLKTDFILTFQKGMPSLNTVQILTLEQHYNYLMSKPKQIIETQQEFQFYEIFNQLFQYFLTKNQFVKISDMIKIIHDNYI